MFTTFSQHVHKVFTACSQGVHKVFRNIFIVFACKDFRKGVSGANVDTQSDFDVRLVVVPRKLMKINETPFFRSENCDDFLGASKDEMLGIV